MKQLAGRVAILTGASRGIGPTIANRLAEQGLDLVLVARSADQLQQEAQRLRTTYAIRTLVVPANLAAPSSAADIVQRATHEFGRVDILVNNAGGGAVGPFAGETPDAILDTLRLDFATPVILTRAVLPQMQQRGEGHIVHVSSIISKVDAKYTVSYAAAKAGLTHFSRSLRAELRGSGVSSSAVSPSIIGGAGMAQNWIDHAGVKPPKLMGSVSADQVAKGVLKAIRKDKAEVLVGPPGSKLLTLSPGFASRIFGRIGAWEMMRKLGEATTDPPIDAPAPGRDPAQPVAPAA